MRKNIHLLLLLAIASVFIISFYGKAIWNADSVMFSNHGDGIKNYYTYAYHINHDSSYVNFEGMNYPYGEHFMYTDCHPALANTFKFLSPVLDVFATNSIGILNLLLIFSVFLLFIISYYLLQAFKLNRWFSLFFSIFITLLAPQIFRIDGHFALSYSIAIPLSWLILIKCFKSEGYGPVALLFFNTLFWLLIHIYLGMIVISFLAIIVILWSLTDPGGRKRLVRNLLILSATVIPLLLIFLYIHFTDIHSDRTTDPSGFFLYNAEFDDVFIPHHGPLRPLLDKITGNSIKLKWEAWSYVGLATTLLFLYLLIISVVQLLFRKRRYGLKRFFQNRSLNISLVAAFIVLLFAMGFPFKQIPSLVDYFPFVKQFRATGRFTWPFYFAAMVFAASTFQIIYLDLRKKKKSIYGLILILLVGILYIVEGLPYHIDKSRSITQSPNLFKKHLLGEDYIKAIDQVDPSSYQAIIALPFYYYGSESYSRPVNPEALRGSIVFSYHTGLPIVNANLTRTSIAESKKIVQLVSPGFYKKEISYDLIDQRPFLLIKTNTKLSKYEKEMLGKGTTIFEGEDLIVMSLSTDELFLDNRSDIYKNFQGTREGLYQQDGFYLSDSSRFLFYNNFEDIPADITYRGSGAFSSEKKGKNILAEFKPNTFNNKVNYVLSIWMHNGEPDALNLWFRLIIEEYDEAIDRRYETTIFPETAEVIDCNWSLVEGTFQVNNPNNKITIVTKGKENSKASLHVDDLLIREEGIDVYKLDIDSTMLFYNNHQIEIRHKPE